MRLLWLTVATLLGAFALLAILRLGEKLFVGALDSQAGVQLVLGVLFGFVAWKALVKAKHARP